MSLLALLNGPPASGKSTIAARLVDTRPMALNLDIDDVRSHLGRWLDDSIAAGLAARALAIAMARTHLRAGHDVIVPQFLARAGFIDELEQLAVECDATFVEIALQLDRGEAIEAFHNRGAHTRSRADAAALVARSESRDPLGEMYDAYVELLASRPTAHRIRVSLGDIEHTVQLVEHEIAGATDAAHRAATVAQDAIGSETAD